MGRMVKRRSYEVSTLIRNYPLPHDCLVCPFFKVNVANAGHGSYLECKANGMRMEIDEIPYIRDERAKNCPMEEVIG